MRLKIMTIVFLLFFSLTADGKDQMPVNDTKQGIVSDMILYSAHNLHYTPRKIDNRFSADLLDAFIGRLDGLKWYFTEEDIADFKRYEKQLDDDLLAGNFDIPLAVFDRFYMKLDLTRKWAEEYLAAPFDFTIDEYIELDPKNREYAENNVALREYWKKIVKLYTMNSYFDIIGERRAEGTALPDGPFEFEPEVESAARLRVRETFNWLFTRYDDFDRAERIDMFLNSVIGMLDPHSMYFPPMEKEDFDLEMTGKFQGIGAVLNESEGFIKVSSIIPGGPSWKDKRLEAEDIILKVSERGSEAVELINMNVRDAVKLIRGDRGTEIKLTVKKPDGRIVFINIIRDTVVMEESYLKYALLKSKDSGKLFGYIYIPKFYRDFQDPYGRNTTDDMKSAIAALRANDISGLILDLRNNGGGALDDAIRVSGLFIKEGPVVQVRQRRGAPHVAYDDDPAVYYEGPLVVMVNNFSASASEIVAGALQDYGRAVIVGDGHTFGKGTVQNIIDLDRLVGPEAAELRPMGALKITTQKYYRVTGESSQYKGIQPDILLPGFYEYIDVGERNYDNALAWDHIAPTDFVKAAAPPYTKKVLAASAARVASNRYFNLIEKQAVIIEKNREDSVVDLNISVENLLRDEIFKQTEAFEKLNETYENAVFDALRIPGEEPKDEESLTRWYEDMDEDVYLEEAVNIIGDMVEAAS